MFVCFCVRVCVGLCACGHKSAPIEGSARRQVVGLETGTKREASERHTTPGCATSPSQQAKNRTETVQLSSRNCCNHPQLAAIPSIPSRLWWWGPFRRMVPSISSSSAALQLPSCARSCHSLATRRVTWVLGWMYGQCVWAHLEAFRSSRIVHLTTTTTSSVQSNAKTTQQQWCSWCKQFVCNIGYAKARFRVWWNNRSWHWIACQEKCLGKRNAWKQ